MLKDMATRCINCCAAAFDHAALRRRLPKHGLSTPSLLPTARRMLSTRHEDDASVSGGAGSLFRGLRDTVAAPGINARAESDAIRLHTQMETERLRSLRTESATIKLRSEMEAKKVEAESDAIKAEVKKLEAESDAIKAGAKKVEAEVAALVNDGKARRARRAARTLMLAAAGAWLAYDYMKHEDRDFIEASMHRYLLARLEAAQAAARNGNAAAVSASVPVYQALQVLSSDRGIMLLGPTGSGKSTLMEQRVQQAMQATDGSAIPAIMLRLRERREETTGMRERRDENQRTTDVRAEAYQELHSLGLRLQEEMGFPTRRWLPLYLYQELGISIESPFVTRSAVAASDRARLMTAFDSLFRVCASMPRPRPEWPGALILIDEVQDLCRSDRLGAVGGRTLFHQLAATIVRYTNDLRAVHVIVGGSSALLSHEFSSTTASTHRWLHRHTEDPSQDDVTAALTARGYTPDEVATIIDTVGLRLRLLKVFLEVRLSPDDVSRTCRDALDGAKEIIRQLFVTASRLGVPEDRVRALLRCVADAHVRGTQVELQEIPESLRSAEVIGKVLFVVFGDRVVFQSRAVERAWMMMDAAPRVQRAAVK